MSRPKDNLHLKILLGKRQNQTPNIWLQSELLNFNGKILSNYHNLLLKVISTRQHSFRMLVRSAAVQESK